MILLFVSFFAYAQAVMEAPHNTTPMTLELKADQTFIETLYFENLEETVVYKGTYTFDQDSGTLTLKASSPVDRTFIFKCSLTDNGDSKSLDLTWDEGSVKLEKNEHAKVPSSDKHFWNDGEIIYPSTCTVQGETLYTCLICGYEESITTAATGHSIKDGVCTICGSSSPSPFFITRTGHIGVIDKNLLPSVVEVPEVFEGIQVKSLGSFRSCKSMTSITIPGSIVSISNSVFSSCSNLTEINYGGSIESWNSIVSEKWNEGLSTTCIIHCSDGDIQL